MLFYFFIAFNNYSLPILVCWEHKYIFPSDVLCFFWYLVCLNKCIIILLSGGKGGKKKKNKNSSKPQKNNGSTWANVPLPPSPSPAASRYRAGTLCTWTARKWVTMFHLLMQHPGLCSPLHCAHLSLSCVLLLFFLPSCQAFHYFSTLLLLTPSIYFIW